MYFTHKIVSGVGVSKDFDDIYRAEISRGRKYQKTPERIQAERLEREIFKILSDPNCSRNRFIATLQRYELSKARFEEYLKKFDLWDRRVL